MRISDWSSDVCSSDLPAGCERRRIAAAGEPDARRLGADDAHAGVVEEGVERADRVTAAAHAGGDSVRKERKSVVDGKWVSGRVDLGGRRSSKKKSIKLQCHMTHVYHKYRYLKR